MPFFRKKPVVIEAIRWDGFAHDGTDAPHSPWPREWDTRSFFRHDDEAEGPVLAIRTLEGPVTARVGDMIIRGVKGEFYPCKPDIFASTYEPAPSPPETPVREWARNPSPWMDPNHAFGPPHRTPPYDDRSRCERCHRRVIPSDFDPGEPVVCLECSEDAASPASAPTPETPAPSSFASDVWHYAAGKAQMALEIGRFATKWSEYATRLHNRADEARAAGDADRAEDSYRTAANNVRMVVDDLRSEVERWSAPETPATEGGAERCACGEVALGTSFASVNGKTHRRGTYCGPPASPASASSYADPATKEQS